MSTHTESAAAYFRAFADDDHDHDHDLALLTDDVVWTINGHRVTHGKAAFAGEIVGEGFLGGPRLVVDRFVDSGETIVVPHTGEARQLDGTPYRLVACDVLTFTGELISAVESFVVPLTAPERGPGEG